MIALFNRLRCALTGHPDSWVRWGAVRHLSGNRIARDLTETCTRCGGVLDTTTLRLEHGQWMPGLEAP